MLLQDLFENSLRHILLVSLLLGSWSEGHADDSELGLAWKYMLVGSRIPEPLSLPLSAHRQILRTEL